MVPRQDSNPRPVSRRSDALPIAPLGSTVYQIPYLLTYCCCRVVSVGQSNGRVEIMLTKLNTGKQWPTLGVVGKQDAAWEKTSTDGEQLLYYSLATALLSLLLLLLSSLLLLLLLL